MSISVIRTEKIGERIQQLVNAVADGKVGDVSTGDTANVG